MLSRWEVRVEDRQVEDGDRELRDLQEERLNWARLKDTPGYQQLMAIAAMQVEGRKQAVFLTPLKSLDGALEQEYQKGEISGIELFRQLVDIRMADLADEINRRTENVDAK
jgi:hypothetical protein